MLGTFVKHQGRKPQRGQKFGPPERCSWKCDVHLNSLQAKHLGGREEELYQLLIQVDTWPQSSGLIICKNSIYEKESIKKESILFKK